MAYREVLNDRLILVLGMKGKVVGVDRQSGKLVWINDLEGDGYGDVELAIFGGHVLVSAQNAKLYCLEYMTGTQLWVAETSELGGASLVVEPDAIFIEKLGIIDCFSHAGAKLWSQPLSGLDHGRISFGFEGNIRRADA